MYHNHTQISAKRKPPIPAIDELSDFDRKVAWVAREFHRAIEKDRRAWTLTFKPHQRAELERILVHLLSRDPVLRRSIRADLTEWHGSRDHMLTVWFWGGANRG